MALEVGQVFAGYTILRVLGSGGMGAVYLVAHPRLPREDALKVLPTDLTDDAEYRARFLREAELVCSLSHPHIVPIHDRGESDGQLWISMDYVAGTDASGLLHAHPGGLALDEVAAIVSAVGSALDYAHHRGFLHRDVKPANILLAELDGHQRRIFLADFGIARRMADATGLTSTNMTVGTAAYAAPEQLRGQPLDGRADQYSLACTAFHLLTGRPPYDNSNPAVVISKHVTAPPPSLAATRPDLAWLDPVFATAMAKNPADRFVNCQDFAHRLLQPPATMDPRFMLNSQPTRQALGFDPAMTAVTTPTTPATRRSRLLIAGLVAAVLLVAGGVFAGTKLGRHDRPAAASTTAHSTAGAPTPAPNAGPFTGVYEAKFGPGAKYDDTPAANGATTTATYAVRSACGHNGCMATASRLDGELRLASTTVFDQIGAAWVAVTVAPDRCREGVSDIWQVLTLQPGPNGTFTGDYRGASPNGCQEKRSVTFTRTSDVDLNSLPDPAALPARVGSPAEALHGRYHLTRTFSSRIPQQQMDESVVTDCLRAGDRCMSYLHSKTSDTPLVFSDGNWAMNIKHDETSPGCTELEVTSTAQYPLPQPPQNPVTRLTGHGHHEQTGNCSISVDFSEIYTRAGD